MSKLRHLSIPKIAKRLQLHYTAPPADAWILIAGLIGLGIIGELTTPGMLVVAIVTALVLIFSEPP